MRSGVANMNDTTDTSSTRIAEQFTKLLKQLVQFKALPLELAKTVVEPTDFNDAANNFMAGDKRISLRAPIAIDGV